MLISKPKDWYKQELQITQETVSAQRNQLRRISTVRLLLFISILFAVYVLFQNRITEGTLLLLICVSAFLFAIKKSLALKRLLLQSKITLQLIQLELDSCDGAPSGKDTGNDLLDLKHPYAHDLDLFGKKSLWHYLNRTLTPDGRAGLAHQLLSPEISIEIIQEKQEIIRELTHNPKRLVQFRVQGLSEEENPSPAAQTQEWLDETYTFLQDPLVRFGRWIFPAITLISLLGYLLNFLPVWLLSLSIGINLLILGRTIQKINAVHNRHSEIGKSIAHHLALIRYWADQKLEQKSLQQSHAAAVNSLKAVHELHTLLNRFDIRLNGLMGILLNTFLLFDYHCLFAIESWKLKHRSTLLTSMREMALLEQWISMGNFAFQRPGFHFPEITTQGEMMAEGLFHPLLNAENAIANTLSLGKNDQLILLTGANMTGKSTWLRAIGLNAVLAYAGLPIAAATGKIPLMRIYTSMRITDDLEEGISYFKAEISRLHDLLSSIRKQDSHWLVLLDEPLRGTNSGDKQAGTIGIIRNLLKLPAIGILATHDASLRTLEDTYPGKVSNFHFDSGIRGNELHFDYTLRSGCSTSNNATLLMRLNGILVDDSEV